LLHIGLEILHIWNTHDAPYREDVTRMWNYSSSAQCPASAADECKPSCKRYVAFIHTIVALLYSVAGTRSTQTFPFSWESLDHARPTSEPRFLRSASQQHLDRFSPTHRHRPCSCCIRYQPVAIGRLLGPFHGAIAVPSVTRCRCRRCRRGHRCAGGVRQYR